MQVPDCVAEDRLAQCRSPDNLGSTMDVVRGYHLPRGLMLGSKRLLHRGSIAVEVLDLDRREVDAVCAAVDSARRKMLKRSLDSRIASIAEVASRWSAGPAAWPDRSLEFLAETTAFSTSMVGHALPLVFETLDVESMQRLYASELSIADISAQALEAGAAPSTLHILAGNIPGVGVFSSIFALMIGGGAILRSSAADLLSPVLWLQSLADVDPELADCLAVVHWPSGNRELALPWFSHADVVIASGSDDSIDAIRPMAERRFVSHGHRISFAAIARERLVGETQVRELADALAYDVSLWDQQGCLSPQICFVEGAAEEEMLTFLSCLAQSLDGWSQKLVPAELDEAERAAIQKFRRESRWRAASSETSAVDLLEGDHWTLAVDDLPQFEGTCLNRCLRLVIVDSLTSLPPMMTPHRRHLETAALAAPRERRELLSESLRSAGVHRVCDVGQMQFPSLSWRQGGRPRFADWLSAEVETQ